MVITVVVLDFFLLVLDFLPDFFLLVLVDFLVEEAPILTSEDLTVGALH